MSIPDAQAVLDEPSTETLNTGIAGLDILLRGGLPRQSLTAITGLPGSGKTVLATQIGFSIAKTGRKVLFFSGLSESNTQLLRQLRRFDFFDASLVGSLFQINSLSSLLNEGLDTAFDAMHSTVRAARPALVILDSFRSLSNLMGDVARVHKFLYDLHGRLEVLGITGLFTYEGEPEGSLHDPGLTVPDGVIGVYHEAIGVQRMRSISIQKMRACDFLPGRHTLAITYEGINIYPRQETVLGSPIGESSIQERIAFGLPELDTMLSGGLSAGTSTLIIGSPGTGKTLLGLHYLAEGAKHGEAGLWLGFRESEAQLLTKADQFGLDLRSLVNQGLVQLLIQPPVELKVDIALSGLRNALEKKPVKRIVVDSVTEFEIGVLSPERTHDLVAALVTYLRNKGVSAFFIKDLSRLIGPSLDLSDNLSPLAENLLLLQCVEYGGELHRVLSILKMRFSDFDRSIREFIVTSSGLQIKDKLESAQGVLTGVASLIAVPAGGQEAQTDGSS